MPVLERSLNWLRRSLASIRGPRTAVGEPPEQESLAPSRLPAFLQPLPEGVTEEQVRALSLPRAEVLAMGAQAPLALEMLETSQASGHVNPAEERRLRELLQHPLPLGYRKRLVDSRFREFLLEHAPPEAWLDEALFDFCLLSPFRASDVAKNPHLSETQVRRLEDWQMEWLGPRAEEFCALEFGEHINITCTLIYAAQAGHALREETQRQLYQWALQRSEEEERARDRARDHNHRVQTRHPGIMVVGGKDEIPSPMGVVTERASTAASILLADRRTPPEWLVEIYRVQSGTHNVGGMDDQLLRHPALTIEHYRALLQVPYVRRYPTLLLRAPEWVLQHPEIRAHVLSAEELRDYHLEQLLPGSTTPEEAVDLLARLASISEERAWRLFGSEAMRTLRPQLPTTVLAPWLESRDPRVREQAMRHLGEMQPREPSPPASSAPPTRSR